MLQELGKEHEVRAFNFKRQYPSLLFPGKTQYVSEDDNAPKVESERLLDSINPCSWGRTAKEILKWGPDLVIIAWWMSFFAPSMGWVARYLNKRGVKTVGLIHNALPHESHFWDKPLTKYFLNGCKGFITLSAEVQSTLLELGPYKSKQLFHPVYSQFGETVPRTEAEKALGVVSGKKNLLFFGLIRKYKGLDILIKAFGLLPEEYRLIIAGEPYGSFEEYAALIRESPSKERIHCFLSYIADEKVKKFFSAADLSVLPYRSASQSGIIAVSYNFEVPLVVTDTGSLRQEVEAAGTGIVAEDITPEALADAIKKFFGTAGLQQKCKQKIKKELDRLSWNNFCKALLDYTDKL
jgi:glycosyltransferase involved in cell wall biosynthesis